MSRVTVIAEAGVNHNGDLGMALKLVEAAAAAGADFVKFQTFRAENLATPGAGLAEYQKREAGGGGQLELLRALELDVAAHRALVVRCAELRIGFLSTPFDEESLSLLLDVCDLPFVKIPSGELTNAPFLLRIARTGKSAVLSTGMSTLEEVRDALSVLAFGYLGVADPPGEGAFRRLWDSGEARRALAVPRPRVTLLHCTTEYPCPFGEVNLRAMLTLSREFGLPVGYSDHTPGIAVPVAAAALGASVIEKHFTLDRGLPGPDHRASLEPGELRAMVESIRAVESALGDGVKKPSPSEAQNAGIARKSLVAARAIRKGERFTEGNLAAKRPGTGIPPLRYWDWLGRTAARDFERDEPIG